MKKSFQKNNHILWAYAILIILVSIPILFKPKFLPYATPFLAILMPIFTFLNNKGNALAEKIDGVKPVWKFLSVDSEIEYFSLDRSKSVVDNVRYYSLIVDDHDNIQSINKLNKSVMPSVKDKINLNKSDELRQFYFSDNAIVKSEEIYQLNLSPLFNEHDPQSKPQAKTIFISETDGLKKLNIIKATTIYGDDTYFFESGELSGGLTKMTGILTKINGEYKSYSGNWKHKDIKRAKNYLDQLEEKIKNDKKDRMKKLKKATPEADSYITKTTTIKQPKNE